MSPLSERDAAAAPIGVFDSGVGGLTVVRALARRLPRERVVYFGDTAYVPYGPRPPGEIRRFALDACRFLEDQGVKLVAMGCNMSSALALEHVRQGVGVPVLGTVQAGAQLTVASTRGGPVGVVATEGTVRSRAFSTAIGALRREVEVLEVACPDLVPLVEAGAAPGELQRAVARYVQPLREAGVDTLVLGCTHYPLLRPQFEAALGRAVRLVDPAVGLAQMAAEHLAEAGLLNPASADGVLLACYASGSAESLCRVSGLLLGRPVSGVQQVDLHRNGRPAQLPTA